MVTAQPSKPCDLATERARIACGLPISQPEIRTRRMIAGFLVSMHILLVVCQ
jgi:hypothetical protein